MLAASRGKRGAAGKPGLKASLFYIRSMPLAHLKEPRKKQNADSPGLSHTQAHSSKSEAGGVQMMGTEPT